MAAIRINASVRTLITPLSVNQIFIGHTFTDYSGDIAVSRKTVHKLMKLSGDSNTAMWNAYPDSKVDLWDQNVVNGEFVIAYEINPGLDHKLQNMLPKVYFLFVKLEGGAIDYIGVGDGCCRRNVLVKIIGCWRRI